MLIVLKGEDIEQQLEIVHRRFTHHVHMILNIIARKAFHQLLHLIEGTLHRVALSVILMSRFAANRHIELHLRGKAWHEVVTSSQLEILTEGRRRLNADTRGSCSHREIQVLENIMLLPILEHGYILRMELLLLHSLRLLCRSLK